MLVRICLRAAGTYRTVHVTEKMLSLLHYGQKESKQLANCIGSEETKTLTVDMDCKWRMGLGACPLPAVVKATATAKRKITKCTMGAILLIKSLYNICPHFWLTVESQYELRQFIIRVSILCSSCSYYSSADNTHRFFSGTHFPL